MKNRRWMLVCSLLLNAALLLSAAVGYAYYLFERHLWESEAFSWGLYAGTMQAVADHENGTRRLYRLVPATSSDERSSFTGEHEAGVEVWTRLYHPILGEPARLSNESFVRGYNNRMRNFIAEGTTATRPAD